MHEPTGAHLIAALLSGLDRIADEMILALLALLGAWAVLGVVVAATVHLAGRAHPRTRPPR